MLPTVFFSMYPNPSNIETTISTENAISKEAELKSASQN